MIEKLTVKITRDQFEKLRSMRQQHAALIVRQSTDAEFAGVVLAAAIADRFARHTTEPVGKPSSGDDDFADDEVISLTPAFVRDPCIVV
jgi:hypothetical protein